MSLEFAEKVRSVRESLKLNQQDFAGLLEISPATVSKWESLGKEGTSCWERIIQFIIDCPQSALEFLQRKLWANEAKAWPERITQLRETLGWSVIDLTDFIGIDYNTVGVWMRGGNIKTCDQIMMSLLEVYSEVDKKEWPPALHFEAPDVVTEERVRLLRLSLGKTQVQLGNMLHVARNTVSRWENGVDAPGWSANLLLRMIETWPRSVELLERIPWDDGIITPEVAVRIRESLGLTLLEMAHLLGASQGIAVYEHEGIADLKAGSSILVYRLIQEYQEEFLHYIRGLSSPGGQACPIW